MLSFLCRLPGSLLCFRALAVPSALVVLFVLPAASAAQTRGTYDLEIRDRVFSEGDTNVQASFAVFGVANNGPAPYDGSHICYFYQVVPSTASRDDVWIGALDAPPVIGNEQTGLLVMNTNTTGGAVGTIDSIVIAGDHENEADEIFYISIRTTALPADTICDSATRPRDLGQPRVSFQITIEDDDEGLDPVPGTYTLAIPELVVFESNVDAFTPINVSATATDGSAFFTEPFCYFYDLLPATATREDVWIAGPGRDPAYAARPPTPVSGLLVFQPDGSGGGSGLVDSLVVRGDSDSEGDEVFHLRFGTVPNRDAGCAELPVQAPQPPYASFDITITDDDIDYQLAIPNRVVVESDVDAFAHLTVTANAIGGSVFLNQPLCYFYDLSPASATREDVWLASGGDPTYAARPPNPVPGLLVLQPDGSGGGSGVVDSLVVRGDSEREADEVFHLRFGAVPNRDAGCAALPVQLPQPPYASFTITIEDDDSEQPLIVPGEYTLSLAVTVLTEGDSDQFAFVHVDGVVVDDEADGYATTPLCYSYALQYGSATFDDLWVSTSGNASVLSRPREPIPGLFILQPDGLGAASGIIDSLAVAGDNLVEGTEAFSLLISIAPVRGSSCHTSAAVVPRTPFFAFDMDLIDDDDEDDLPGAGVVESLSPVLETDIDFVTILSATLRDTQAVEPLCYPYVVGYGESSASPADVWLVRSVGDHARVPNGTFIIRPDAGGGRIGVSTNLLIAGDQIVEPVEIVYLYVYAPVPVGVGVRDCSPVGDPTLKLRIELFDDDAPLSISDLAVRSSIDGAVFEGDAGDPPTPVVLTATFTAYTTEPVTLVFGSMQRGTALPSDVDFIDRDTIVVSVGQLAVDLLVAHVIPDNRVEGADTFLAWVQLLGYPSTRIEIVITIANDDITGDQILTVEFVGFEGLAVEEGDPAFTRLSGDTDPCRTDWRCIPFRLTLDGRQPKDVVYEFNILGGTAVPHEDYAPLDGVRLTLREGHLSALDINDPLRLEIRRDYVAEPDEDFYVVVHQLAAGGAPLLSWFEQIVILDDDAPIEGGSTWFGTRADYSSCPTPSARSFLVEEPPATGVAVSWPLTLVMRAPAATGLATPGVAAPGDDEGPAACNPVGSAKPVDYYFELSSDTARLGVDVALAGSSRGNLVRFIDGEANLEILVFGDGSMEPLESLNLQLYSGQGPVAAYTILISDFETRYEQVTAQMATYARLGRAFASEVADVLAERFSCAGSAACVSGAPGASRQLWPEPTVSRSVVPAMALRRLTSALVPAHALAGDLLSPSAFPVSAGTYPSAGPASSYGSLSPSGGGMGSAFGAPAFTPLDRLALLGRAVDGVRFQGDPGRWLGTRNIAVTPDSEPAWSAWGRVGFAEAIDAGSTGRSLRTSILSMTGGIDRAAGPLRIGWLHSRLYATDDVDYHWRAAEVLPGDTQPRSTAWQMTGPYIGVVPVRRLRFWVAPGWIWGRDPAQAGGAALPGAQGAGGADPLALLANLAESHDIPLGSLYPSLTGIGGSAVSMRFLVAGGSLSLLATGPMAVDLEGDFFDVGGVSAGGVSNPLVYAQRRRLALRIALPLGAPEAGRSRLSLRAARRWDSGTDLDWVWGGISPIRDWVGAGYVAATDLMADYRLQAPRAAFSLVLTAGVQFDGELPVYPGEDGRESPQSSRARMAATMKWGASGTTSGWSMSLRPRYGHAGVSLPGWWDAGALGGMGRINPVPMFDAEVAYAFANRARLSVGTQTVFDDRMVAGAARTLGVFRFSRGW